MSFLTRKPGDHRKAAPVGRPEVGLLVTEDNPHPGPAAPQPRAWRKKGSWASTAPYVEVHAPRTPQPQPATGPAHIPDPRPYVPEPPPPFDPLTAEHAEMLMRHGAGAAAVLARTDPRFTTLTSLSCGRQGCTRTHTRGGTRSFTDLHTAAIEDGWRKDAWDAWMCPGCQQKPGYYPASTLTPVTAWDELGLAWDVHAATGPGWRHREALRDALKNTEQTEAAA